MNTISRDLKRLEDWQDIKRCLRIGEILLMAGKIKESKLIEGLDLQDRRADYIGKILLSLKAVKKSDLTAGLELQEKFNPTRRF